MQPPDVSYARSGEVAVAYQLVGTGPPDLVFIRGIAGDLLSILGAAAACTPRRGSRCSQPGTDARQARDGTLRSCAGGAIARDGDGRRPSRDGCGRHRERRSLDGREQHRDQRALRGDVSRALRRSCPVRPDGQGDPLRRLPVGADRGGMAREADQRARADGARAATSRSSPASGRPRSPRTRLSATGSSGTCAAASAPAQL